MTNIFLLYIPFGNYEAQVHYEDTIKQKVLPDRIFRFVDPDLKYTQEKSSAIRQSPSGAQGTALPTERNSTV